MIVSRETARLIREGRKTEARIPCRSSECPVTVGRSYALQVIVERTEQELYGFSHMSVGSSRKGKPPRQVRRRRTRRETVGHVFVAEVKLACLGELDFYAARAEGFRTTDEFLAHWADQPYGDTDPTRLVWVLTLAADVSDHPRLLHRRSEVGYTTKRSLALVDEPEAVDRETLERFAREAEPDNARRRELRAVEAREEHAAARRDRVTRIKARTRGDLDGEAAA